MTNYDYIISRLTERNLTELFLHGCLFYKENFNNLVQKAFKNWMKNNDNNSHGNFENNYEDIKRNHSVFGFWEQIHNRETDEWIEHSRTKDVKFSLWLSMQYNEKEWKEKE